MKKLSVFLILIGFLLFSAGTASSFPLWPGTGTTAGTIFQDDNRDYLLNLVGNADTIDIGDVLIAAIEFPSVEQSPSGPVYATDQAVDELVAISVIQLKSITDIGLSTELWWFGEWTTDTTDTLYTTLDMSTDDSMVKFYSLGSTTNLQLNLDQSLDTSIASIVDGTPLWSFSVTTDEDTFWVFDPSIPGADSISAVNQLNSTTKVGLLNYALNQTAGSDIFNNIALDAFTLGLAATDGSIDDGLVDMTGSGDILGGGNLNGGAFARSDIDTAVNPIPEPATMSLFGLGLLGLAAISRRRK